MNSTSETGNKMVSKNKIHSSSFDKSGTGSTSSGGGNVLKKGPWTSAEDAILVDYVNKYGEGNWNAVQKHSGLFRCGKSCRLRWTNHLRPNLRKGAFSPEEEQRIAELHAKLGNKWACISQHLHGRTDNEIKNYWNTRIKRHQRTGLPLYPPGLTGHSSNENLQEQSTMESDIVDIGQIDNLLFDNLEIPNFAFDNLQVNQDILSHALSFPSLSVSNTLIQGIESHTCGIAPPINYLSKQLWAITPNRNSILDSIPMCDHFSTGISENIEPDFSFGYACDPDPEKKYMSSFGSAALGSHAFSNGNLSASQSLSWSAKLELPSFQYPESDPKVWLSCSVASPHSVVNECVESLQAAEAMQSDCDSPRNNGLLDSLVYEGHARSTKRKVTSEKSSSSSVNAPNFLVGSSPLSHCDTDWEAFSYPTSPLQCFAPSDLKKCKRPRFSSSLDEGTTGNAYGLILKTESDASILQPNIEEKTDVQPSVNCMKTKFDASIDPDWYSNSLKDQCAFADTIVSLLGEDLCKEYKHTVFGTSAGFEPGTGHDSCWSNMRAVCEMYENP